MQIFDVICFLAYFCFYHHTSVEYNVNADNSVKIVPFKRMFVVLQSDNSQCTRENSILKYIF